MSTVFCPICGAINPEDSVFCEMCGTKIRMDDMRFDVTFDPTDNSVLTSSINEPVAEIDKICPVCGFTNESDSSFCEGCGSPLEEAFKPESVVEEAEPITIVSETVAESGRICPVCGFTSEADSTFCEGCGSPLEETFKPESVIEEAEPVSVVNESVAKPESMAIHETERYTIPPKASADSVSAPTGSLKINFKRPSLNDAAEKQGRSFKPLSDFDD